MPVRFEITSEKPVTIDAVGLVSPDLPPVVLSEQSLRLFEVYHGVSLSKAKFPDHVKVTTVLVDEVTTSVEEV